jgi:hypothetical protein
VQYAFDSFKKTVNRSQANYGQALKKQFGAKKEVSRALKSVSFLYGYPTRSGVTMQATVKKGKVPLAVLINVEFLDFKGRVQKMQKLINIPIGQWRWIEGED